MKGLNTRPQTCNRALLRYYSALFAGRSIPNLGEAQFGA